LVRRAPENITAGVSELERGGRDEATCVKPAIDGVIGETPITDAVGRCADPGVGDVARPTGREGETALKNHDSRHAPAARNLLRKVRGSVLEEGDLVNRAHSEVERHVAQRWPAVATAEIRISAFGRVAVVDRPRPSEGAQDGQPVAEPPLDLALQRVVDRGGGLLIPSDIAEVGVGSPKLN